MSDAEIKNCMNDVFVTQLNKAILVSPALNRNKEIIRKAKQEINELRYFEKKRFFVLF